MLMRKLEGTHLSAKELANKCNDALLLLAKNGVDVVALGLSPVPMFSATPPAKASQSSTPARTQEQNLIEISEDDEKVESWAETLRKEFDSKKGTMDYEQVKKMQTTHKVRYMQGKWQDLPEDAGVFDFIFWDPYYLPKDQPTRSSCRQERSWRGTARQVRF